MGARSGFSTTSRRCGRLNAQARSADVWLFQPATAMRIDNDVFLGSPLPPEEPAAKNPPDGAMIDYYLKSPAKDVKLEIFDARQQTGAPFLERPETGGEQHPPQAIAERWLPKPLVLENTAGMHRFLWDLRWSSSGTDESEEDEGFGAPRGPSVSARQLSGKTYS